MQLVRHDEAAEPRRAKRSARGFFLVDAVDWVFVVVFCFKNDSQGKKCSALRMDVIETGNKGHLARKAASRTVSRDSAGYISHYLY